LPGTMPPRMMVIEQTSFPKERDAMDPTFKKTEIVGTSARSFSDAVAGAIAKAAQTLPNMSWFEVVEQRGHIADGKVQQYQVTLRIGSRMD